MLKHLAKIAEAESEEDTETVDLIARLVCSHREAAYKRAKISAVKVSNFNQVVTVTKPTAYTSGLITVQYNIPVDEAQLGIWSSSMMHGADVPPIIPISVMQIAAGMDTQHKKGKYVLTKIKLKYNPTISSCISIGNNRACLVPQLLSNKMIHQLYT